MSIENFSEPGEHFGAVSRFELIDDEGRQYVRYGTLIRILVSIQDDGQTMKIFVKEDPAYQASVHKGQSGKGSTT